MTEQYAIATSDDYARIAQIYNEHIESNLTTMVERYYTAADIKNWVDQFNDREQLYVVSIDGQLIGWGIIKRYSDRAGYRYAAETSVFLAEQATGKGIGTRFKQYIINQCRAMNYHHLVAKIFNSNRRSIAYNLALGYEIVGVQKEVGFKNGQWEDICIMRGEYNPYLQKKESLRSMLRSLMR